MVANTSEKYTNLAIRLFDINAFKFGNYKMKNTVSEILVEFLHEKRISCDHICGVPYTALPIATLVSVRDSKPMLIRRKEAKEYGTKKLIEGKFHHGDTCLIIEDVITSGSSILETVQDLRQEGIIVTDAVVLVDREQGGARNIEENGIRIHSLFSLSQLLNILQCAGKIEDSTVRAVAAFISNFQINMDGSMVEPINLTTIELNRRKMTFETRAEHAKCAVARKLFHLMATKETNLCVAVDFPKADSILNLVEQIGPHICVLKTHVDIIEDFSEHFVNALTSLAEKYNFLILEDRKFADIGNTVSLQYAKGIYNICDWADLVTSHSLPGKGVLDGLKNGVGDYSNKGVFLVAELCKKGDLINTKYTKDTMELAMDEDNDDFVAGIVCQNLGVVTYPGLIQMTPGILLNESNDELTHQYNSPETVVRDRGADIAVVGRGITCATNVAATAKEYRDQLWAAYCDRIIIE